MRGLGFAMLAGSMLLAACGDDCDPSGNWCEDNVLFACASEGGGRVGTACATGTQCAGTRCYPEPLEACMTGVPEGGRRCDLAKQRPGTCTEDGFMLWDAGERCLAENTEQCQVSILSGPEDPGEALCVAKDQGPCRAGTSPPTCHNNLLLKCSEISYYVIDRDCSLEGKVCSQQQCQ